jgi:asparagine synthase (glutamine-hydrolysing)
LRTILGVFNRDGRPILPGDYECWLESISVRPALSREEWNNTCVRLTAIGCRQGHAGSIGKIAARARIDNRDELFRLLDVPSSQQNSISDEQLIASAYEKWGFDLGSHLLGDWAFALWDQAKRSLILGHDFLGAAGFYYYLSDERLIFASSLSCLLANPAVPQRLNPLAIAQMSSRGKRDTASFYRDIFSLQPAHIVAVTATGMQSRAYWHPSQIRSVRLSSDDAYVEMFREIFSSAVRCRLQNSESAGIFLSGGLDSSSVAALAAPELAGRNQILTSWTWVPGRELPNRRSADCLDESGRVAKIRDHVGNLETFFVKASVGPLAGIRRVLGIIGQPSYIASSAFWMTPLFDAARSHGARTLLTGDWGNFTISWRGEASVLPRFRSWADRTFNTLRSAAGNEQWNPRSAVRPGTARRYLAELPSVNPELERLRRQSRQPLQSIYNLLQAGSVAIATGVGAHFGLDIMIPPLDKHVVEFCLGIPDRCYACMGQTRLLIREAMDGLLPDEVVWTERRGRVLGDFPAWIRAEYDEIAEFLDRLRKSPLAQEWLDIPLMAHGLDAVQRSDSRAAINAFGPTYGGLGLGLFFLEHEHA